VKADAKNFPAGKPAVLYLRRSTDRQEQSIDDQRAFLMRYAGANGFEVVGEYLDDGISGTSADGRADFQRMIAEAQAKPKFRFVMCYSVSRFSRGDVDEAGYYRHVLRQQGIEVVYASENIQDEQTEELVRPMLQTLARRESAQLSIVTARGQMSAIKKGSYHGSTPCWGYDYEYSNTQGEPYQRVRYLPNGEKEVFTPKGKGSRRTWHLLTRYPFGSKPPRADGDSLRLVPSLPERVETIQRIFEMYVREGKGHRSIAFQLTAEGVSSPRCGAWGGTFYDGRWGITTVRSILLNAAYIGHTVWNKRTQGKFHRIQDGQHVRRSRQEAGSARPNARSDWVYKHNTHEPLVNADVFEAAQKIMASRDLSSTFRHKLLGRGRTSNFLLAGLVRCKLCGNRFMGWSQRLRSQKNLPPEERCQAYLCGGYVSKGLAVCRRNAIDKGPFEEFIIGQVHQRLLKVLDEGGSKLLRAYVREELLKATGRPDEDLRRVDGQLAGLKAEADRLLANLTEANREFIDDRLIVLKGQRRELEARHEALRAATRRPVDVDRAVDEAMGYLGKFRDVLARGSFLEQKEFLRAFVVSIDLDPAAKKGVLHMHNMVAASFCISGWNRPKLYRRMQRFEIPRSFGRP